MVPIFTTDDVDIAVAAASALADGGATAIEFTDRSPRAFEAFSALRLSMARLHPEVILGVGSIADGASAGSFIGAGADFVVGAFTSSEVTDVCRRHDVPYIPGCGTATEIAAAQAGGADLVKVFPAGSLGGPGFVRAVLGPMPWTSIMATGEIGVEPDELGRWFDAGVACVGLGSALVASDILSARRWEELERRTSRVVSLVAGLR